MLAKFSRMLYCLFQAFAASTVLTQTRPTNKNVLSPTTKIPTNPIKMLTASFTTFVPSPRTPSLQFTMVMDPWESTLQNMPRKIYRNLFPNTSSKNKSKLIGQGILLLRKVKKYPLIQNCFQSWNVHNMKRLANEHISSATRT